MKLISTNHLSRRSRALPLALGLALSTGVVAPHADVAIAEFDGYGDYSYAVNFMADIDQRRDILPSDGSLHCGPTSIMNLFAYAANFGFPELQPTPGVWEGVLRHLEMSFDVFNLGVLMGTDDGGTGGTGLFNGAVDWLDENDHGAMSFVSFTKGGGYWPVIDDGTAFGWAGGVVSFCYGRYVVAPGGPDGIPWLTDRNLGHCVTLQRSVADNGDVLGPRELQSRDPANPNDGDLSSNSQYTSTDYATAANIEIARDIDGDGVFNIYPVTSLVNPPPADDPRYRIIDGFYALYPPGGMSYTEVEVAAQFANGQLGFVQGAQPVPSVMPAGTRVLSVVPHPELHSALALLEQKGGGKFVARIPHAPAKSSKPKEIVVVGSVPADSVALVLGYGHSAFVVGQKEILHLEAPGQTAHLVARAPLPKQVAPYRIDAATYNNDSHEILLISGTQRRLFAIDPSTLKLKGAFILHAPFPVGAVRSLVAWGGRSGRIVAALDNGRLMQIDYQPRSADGDGDTDGRDFLTWQRQVGTSLNLPGVANALSVDVDSGGRLYVSDKRAGLLEFTPHPTRGWQKAAKPLYAKFNLAGRKFAPFKNRTNVRPELHDTREWNNMPADEVIPLGPEIPDTRPQR